MLLPGTDRAAQVFAVPDSVQLLPGMSNDVRTLDKLWDGHNSTFDDRNMWLVPYSPGAASSCKRAACD